MIIVTGSFIAKEGHIETALEHSLAHVQRSRLEPGCISHAVHIDAENPQRLFFFEEWESMAALKVHFKVPESKQFGEKVLQMSDSVAPLTIYEATELNG
jgi:quinol monooxygenase YgiN